MTEVQEIPVQEVQKQLSEPRFEAGYVPTSSTEDVDRLTQRHALEDLQAIAILREQNADLLGTDRPSANRPRLAELRTKFFAPGAGKEYTPAEAFYLEHGWKAYLQSEYGKDGYTLEDIARTEKLDASEIRNAIAEGIVTDPKALSLYGKLRIEQTEAYFNNWTAKRLVNPEYNTYEDRDFIQTARERGIALTRQECTPLVWGNHKDLASYCLRQAQYDTAISKNKAIDITDEEREQHISYAQNWLTMAERLGAKPTNGNNEPTTQPTESTLPQELTPEQQETFDHLKANPALLDALRELQNASKENIEAFSEKFRHDVRNEQLQLLEQRGDGLLDLLFSLLSALKDIPLDAIKRK
jgi:hypothetical protein